MPNQPANRLLVTTGTGTDAVAAPVGAGLSINPATKEVSITAVITDASNVAYTNPAYPLLATVKDALDMLLYTSLTASMSCAPTEAEIGSTVNSITLNWSYNKAVTSQSIDQGIGALAIGLRTYNLTGQGLTISKTWTLTGSDGINTAHASASVMFKYPRYWGVDAQATPDQTLISNLSGELATSRAQSRTMDATGGRYLYFAWPSSFGEPSFIVNGFPNSAWIKTVVSFTNSSGYTSNYWVYRSQYLQNGSGITVVVS
jgi:hypothetical protein